MKDTSRLTAIAQINELVLDQRLSALKAARAARVSTQARIAALDVEAFESDCSLKEAAQAAVLYQIWCDERRKQLNLQLAKQKVAEMEADADARIAFSKKTAFQGLAVRLAKGNGRP